MDRPKLLIADDSDEFTQSLVKALGDCYTFSAAGPVGKLLVCSTVFSRTFWFWN